MNLNVEQIDGVNVVEFQTETLDADNSKEFANTVQEILDGTSKVVFDLKDLSFIDSSGLGTILSCLRKLQEHGGDLKLCNMSKPVRAMFELVRMHRVVEIYNTKEEAVRSF